MKRRWPVYAAGAVALLGLAAFVTPEIAVRTARARATECLASAHAPRGPELPDCSHLVDDFEMPSQVSYTRHDATYRAEELYSRIAINRYVDAATGSPDPDRLHAASFGVQRAQKVIEEGSQRVSLEDLGPVVGAPHLGKLAGSIGDRSALLRQPEFYGLWSVRVLVLEAALLEGDVELASDIAERYADWDPRDADLRTAVGSILCMTNPRRGQEILDRVPKDRADRRYANIQRNFGEVVAVTEACAARLGEEAPLLPPQNGAGEPDAVEVRLLTSLRFADGERRKHLLERVIDRLQGEGSGGVAPDARYARAMLAGTLLASPNDLQPAVVANLVTPRPNERPFAPVHLTPQEILVEPPGLVPRASAAELEAAADAVRGFAERSELPLERERLKDAAAGFLTLAAADHARAGRVTEAVAAAERAATEATLSPSAAALSVASAAYVAGDPGLALRRLEAAHFAASPGKEDVTVMVSLAALDALVLASVGMLDEARKRAVELPHAATPIGTTIEAFDARWVAVALGEHELQLAAPPRLTWLGAADPQARHLERAQPAIDAGLTAWSGALGSAGDVRRAFRYQLLERRGDAPAFILPYLVAAARLLDDDASNAAVETWLDTASAIDARRLRMRSYVWARAEAARIRGDDVHADLWRERLAKLRELAASPETAEMAEFLRL